MKSLFNESCPVSTLYSLNPIRLDFIESSLSYTSRLATEHCLTARDITAKLILHHINREYLHNTDRKNTRSISAFYKKQSRTLLGTKSLAGEWASALEKLTSRNDLRYLSMLPYAALLSPRGLIRKFKAWCPACFEEMKNDQGYEPLLWSVEIVKVCPIHQCLLSNKCPSCGELSIHLPINFHPGYCSYCSTWLGHSENKKARKQYKNLAEINWDLWISSAVNQMINQAKDFEINISPEFFSNRITELLDNHFNRNATSFSKELHISRDTITSWAKGTQLPTIDYFLRILYLFDISLNNFFSMDSLKIRLNLYPIPPSFNAPGMKKPDLNKSELQRKLTEIIQKTETPPPSLSEIAKRFNHDLSHLSKLFPDQCKEITSTYKRYLIKRKEAEIAINNTLLQTAIIEFIKSGIFPNKFKITKKTGIKFWSLEENKAYDQLLKDLKIGK